ncbi:MAG TPA: DNA polymerase III subunit delta [Bacillota bacterium]
MKISGQKFLRRLEEGFLPRVLLFQGEEEYWLNRGVAEMRRRLFPDHEEEFNLVDLEAKTLEAGVLKTTLLSLPFLFPTRLIILRGIEEMKPDCDQELLQGLKGMPDGIYLVATAKKADQRKKAIKELISCATVVDCSPLKVYEVKQWLIEEGRELGLKLTAEVTDLLIERRGTSLGLLRQELEKALIYQGEGQIMTLAEWADLVGASAESNIFALIDQTSAGNSKAALQGLAQLLKDGEPEMKILFMLGKQIRQLFIAWLFLQEGKGEDALREELKCHPFVAGKLLAQGRRLSFAQLCSAMHRILQADWRVKTGMSDQRLELEMAVLDLSVILAC